MRGSEGSDQYKVALSREDGIWLIEASGPKGVRSFGRTVRDAVSNIREAIAAAEDLDEWEGLDLVFTLDNEAASDALKAFRHARQEEEYASAERDRTLKDAIDTLRRTHTMSYRDIGAVLGLSHQRVAQLASEARV